MDNRPLMGPGRIPTWADLSEALLGIKVLVAPSKKGADFGESHIKCEMSKNGSVERTPILLVELERQSLRKGKLGPTLGHCSDSGTLE